MKLHVIACEALARECYRAAADSPHIVSVALQHFGLHNSPDDLRETVQDTIDTASDGTHDYILLAYGLCSRGTADLVARDTPVVIPRAHDCITLLLGSGGRYEAEFKDHPGTYYFSSGWIERKDGEVTQSGFGIVQDRLAEERLREYIEKYGEENAEYLMEQEKLWTANYDRAAFINTGVGDIEYYREFTQKVADSKGWSYEEIEGNIHLVARLLAGDWDPSEFLVLQPGQRTVEDVNNGIITAG